MNNNIKSMIMLAITFCLLALLIYLVYGVIKILRNNGGFISIIGRIIAIVIIMLVLPTCLHYSRVGDISIELEPVDCIQVKEDLSEYRTDHWYCLYNMSPSFIPDEYANSSIRKYFPFVEIEGEYPQTDYSQYGYLVSYGRPIDVLKYNVWDTCGVPLLDLGLSNKWGKVEHSNDSPNNCIYIYRFKRFAIDNIVNTYFE